MANRLWALIVLSVLTVSCTRETFNVPSFDYPDSKFWAHRVNTVSDARERALLFDGLEVDLNYNEHQDLLFVGHDLWDTINGVSFGMWLDSLPQPINNCIWLDIKNLSPDNAPRVAHQILEASCRYGIQNHIMAESMDHKALKTIKDSGIHVILWVNTPYWTGSSFRKFRRKTQAQIDYLHPDAISGDHNSFPLLIKTFPEQNIHIWDTPREYNDTNIAHSQSIASIPSVKVVLVDYPVPPDED